MNLRKYLLPEDALEYLAAVGDDELIRVSRVARQFASIRELRFALSLQYLSTRLPTEQQDPLKIFYTRLYWFNRFISEFERRSGFDAGLAGQASDILGQAPAEVDWQVVETIIEVAKTGPA